MKRNISLWGKLGALLVAVVLAVGLLPAIAFADATPAVNDAKQGVYFLKVSYKSKDGVEHPIQYGSAFCINDTTFLTCYHVCTIDAKTGDLIKQRFGDEDYQSSIVYKVVLSQSVEAELEFNPNRGSSSVDFAILNLKDQVKPPYSLSLGSSSEVKQTEQVWTLGYPDSDPDFTTDSNVSFTPTEVTVNGGTISKLLKVEGVPCIQHGAKMTRGNSGGPLIDNKGTVLGINSFLYQPEVGGNDYYSIEIDQVKEALDAWGIPYTLAERVIVDKETLQGLIAQAESTAVDLSRYTDESAAAFTAALTAAQSVNESESATQEQVDIVGMNLSTTQRGLVGRLTLIHFILIGALALAVIAVVIIIVFVVRGRQRREKVVIPPLAALGIPIAATPAQASLNRQPVYPHSSTVPPPTVAASVPRSPLQAPAKQSVFATDSGDTTVLNPSMSETGALGLGKSLATLLRVMNNEKVRIDRTDFIVGKERNKTNFAITNNNAISRRHVRITYHDEQYFIADLETTNFSWLNGVKLTPGVEAPLTKGDRITLADEEFIFDC